MKAVVIGTALGAIVWWIAARIGRWRGAQSGEPMLPEPDTDWTGN